MSQMNDLVNILQGNRKAMREFLHILSTDPNFKFINEVVSCCHAKLLFEDSYFRDPEQTVRAIIKQAGIAQLNLTQQRLSNQGNISSILII